jgi:hypothetical protein
MAELPHSTYNAATAGDDVIFGTSGDDLIDAGEGNDTIFGLAGNDTLFGWTGNDVIDGGDGDDWIFGEGGTDTLTGGAGNDTFGEYDQWLNGDTITDFSVGDVILIRDADISTFTFSLDGEKLTFTGAPTPEFTGGFIMLTGATGAALAASAYREGGVQIVMTGSAPRSDVHNDFNGDHKSDILWRDSNGLLFNWVAAQNGAFASNAGSFSTMVSSEWRIAGTGDFNGDGKVDLLWRQDVTGHLLDWLGTASGGFNTNAANFDSSAPADVHIVGTGDFNGDGKDDILFRNNAGLLFDWLGTSSGGFTSNTANFATVISTEWRVIGTGDFNGDGKDDILWQQDGTGHLLDWLGNGSGGFNTNAANFDSSLPPNIHFAGTGDFNGDGKDDVLWRDDNGLLFDWLGNASGGFTPNTANFATVVSTEWRVVSVGDFNGDTRDDILWRQDGTGHLLDWLGTGSGGFVTNSQSFESSVPLTVHLQDPFL